jgi:hypothetical protein
MRKRLIGRARALPSSSTGGAGNPHHLICGHGSLSQGVSFGLRVVIYHCVLSGAVVLNFLVVHRPMTMGREDGLESSAQPGVN